MKICTCLQDLRIIDCFFSRTLSRVCLPITLKSLVIHQSYNLDFLLLEFFKCHYPLPRTPGNLLFSFRLSLSSTCHFNLYPRLTHLGINNVEGLESLSFSFSEGDPTSLHELSICECPNLVSIELPALSIYDCSISHCENLRSLLHNAACFHSLTIIGCPELRVPPTSLSMHQILHIPDRVGSARSGAS